MGDVGGPGPQHHHGELLLLRTIEADGDVVLRALLRQEHLHHFGKRVLGQEEVVREEALEGRGVGEVRIDGEEIVQEGRAGPPMADDEDRRLVELQALGGAAVFCLGDPIEHRVPRHPQKERQHVGEAVQRERETPAREQLHQIAEAHAEPKIDQPPAIALDGEGGHARFGAAASADLNGFLFWYDLVIRHAQSTPICECLA